MKNLLTERRKNGFTLIELICVIFVIALLFSILMPSLNKAKKMATRVVCGTYMKGYGTLFTIYLNDSDGRFPDPNQWIYSNESYSDAHPAGCRWHDWPMALDGKLMADNPQYRGMMWEYVTETETGPCPEFRDVAPKMGCESPNHNFDLSIKPQNNRTMNAYLGSGRIGGVKDESKVYKPAGKFILSEENAWSVRPDHPKYPARWLTAPLSMKALDNTSLLITPTPDAENCFATYHGASSSSYSDGMCNITYLDGHTSILKVDEQLRSVMHAGSNLRSRSRFQSSYEYEESYPISGGNLRLAWPLEEEPPGGWDAQ